MSAEVVKDLGRRHLDAITCKDTLLGKKKCELEGPGGSSTVEVDDVVMYSVDSVSTKRDRIAFITLESLHCRIEKGDDILTDPSKEYLLCGKQIGGVIE